MPSPELAVDLAPPLDPALTGLLVLGAHVAAVLETIRKLEVDAQTLQRYMEELSGGALSVRGTNGRLTPTGKLRLEQLCSDGARVIDIAHALGISPAAASVNRRKFRERQAAAQPRL